MSKDLNIYSTGIYKLEEYMKEYAGNVEDVINDVLHNDAPLLAHDSIRRLIPVSGKKWKGKAPPASTGNTFRDIKTNLAVEITTTSKYGYLYFPNDGTNTRNHVGNQRFFEKGGEAVKDEIIERCISKLTNNFEKGV
jgi:hypothetical protein